MPVTRLLAYLKGWPTRPRRVAGYDQARGIAGLALVSVLAAVVGVLSVALHVSDVVSWVKGAGFLALSAGLAWLLRTYLRRPTRP